MIYTSNDAGFSEFQFGRTCLSEDALWAWKTLNARMPGAGEEKEQSGYYAILHEMMATRSVSGESSLDQAALHPQLILTMVCVNPAAAGISPAVTGTVSDPAYLSGYGV
ncbi:hypothetical protein LOC54_06515 [Acetobacter sp. AN02]|uniref:hypothetical protein n=1 Tax=Acetobacter sp. AN02 TaxID=2894186 RepID=UPI0024341ECB|nr:hypothetical protein [Acetobacter sp. AN02]MDG6094763.1 hypothetical protein [Acetobacter sp. AN02]